MKNKNTFSKQTLLEPIYLRPNTPYKLAKAVENIIDFACSRIDPFYLKDPKAFSRNSKFGLKPFTMTLISADEPTQAECSAKLLGYGKSRVSSSAITQTKAKVKSQFFHDLMIRINQLFPIGDLFLGKYRLINIDGSNLPIAVNPDEPQFIVKRQNGADHAGIHANFASEQSTGLILDCICQSQRGKNERKAALALIEHYRMYYDQPGVIPVFVMDRGYFSYQIALYCESLGYKYLIRTKEREFMSLFPELIDQEGIQDAVKELSSHQRYKEKNNPNAKYIPKNTMAKLAADFGNGSETISLPIRGVSIKISESADKENYEYLLTNLTDEGLDIDDYKGLYHGRWSIETTIGQVKYGAGMKRIHSKKSEWIFQEIFTTLIMWNMVVAVISRIAQQLLTSRRKRKHEYQVNKTHGVRVMRDYLIRLWNPFEAKMSQKILIDELKRELCPIRRDRSSPRKAIQNRLNWFCWR